MKIYIATSWKNADVALVMADLLRLDGHLVDCFCDEKSGRFVFDYREIDDCENLDAISFLEDARSQKAFEEDKKWLDWAEIVLMILPCGNSAHLEAGYARGCGKKVYIFGHFKKGSFDVMYGFADNLFRSEQLDELREILKPTTQ